MLDLKLIRSDPERVKAALAPRGAAEPVDELLALDARRRELLPGIEGAQAERKALSKRAGEAKPGGRDAAALLDAAAILDDPPTHAVMAAAARALGRPAAADAVAEILVAIAERRPLPDAAAVERIARGAEGRTESPR